MPEYRVHIIGSDGLFHSSTALDCADEDAAIERARHLVDGHDVELWRGDRKIAKFEHRACQKLSPLREQAAEALRRARRLPAGHARNDLRQLAIGLLWLEKRGFVATVEAGEVALQKIK